MAYPLVKSNRLFFGTLSLLKHEFLVLAELRLDNTLLILDGLELGFSKPFSLQEQMPEIRLSY